MVIWLVGLSGSGKTTLGREVARQLRLREPNTVLLDGDEVREVFAEDRGSDSYTVEGRRRNAHRMTALCELLDRQGINVVCCILSIFPEMRAGNRRRFGRYFEVFMNATMASLERRDVKGLYAAARAGRVANVVGVHIPFAAPVDADMVIDSSGDAPDIAAFAEELLRRAGKA